MRKLLIRADDLGYCESINYAINKTIDCGLVMNAGLMVNMDASEHGYNLIKNKINCIGLHVNISVGLPISKPELIPSLIDDNGLFISSKFYNKQNYNEKVDFDELIIEIEAQLDRFIKLTGKNPDYFEGHAVLSDKFFNALEVVASRYNLKYSGFSPDGSPIKVADKHARISPMRSMYSDYDPFKTLQDTVSLCADDMPSIFVAHPGYLDEFVLASSSLTINRTKDCSMLCSTKTIEWIRSQKLDLITYNDIT